MNVQQGKEEKSPPRPLYDAQEHYRNTKQSEGLVYILFAVLLLLYGLIFERSVAAASVYVFIYGLGYCFGRRSRGPYTWPITVAELRRPSSNEASLMRLTGQKTVEGLENVLSQDPSTWPAKEWNALATSQSPAPQQEEQEKPRCQSEPSVEPSSLTKH